MNDYRAAAGILRDADRVLIGASNGLSITEGLHLFKPDRDFVGMFPWVMGRYGASSIIQAAFSPLTDDERWTLMSGLISKYSLDYRPTDVMEDLSGIVAGKDSFVLTTNGEGHFTASGFPEERVYEVEGNWRTMQCSRACHPGIYPSYDAVRAMKGRDTDGRMPPDLIPRCPRCGAPMAIRMQIDANFVPDVRAEGNLRDFLARPGKLTVLELGVGMRNRLIKAPLMDLVARTPGASYITINLGEVYIEDGIRERSVGIDDDLRHALTEIRREMSLP